MLPPNIDPRDQKMLIDQVKDMVPFYTPEWRFTPAYPDPGTALFMLFADMFQENIKRLNRVPMLNFIAFLNMLDVSQLSAKAASAYVTFRLNEGVKDPVWIPANTQITAASPEGDDSLIYETERAVLLTPAVLTTAYQVSMKRDIILKVPQTFIEASNTSVSRPASMFHFTEGDNLQEHCMYISHDDLFQISETARIELNISCSVKRFQDHDLRQFFSDPNRVEWLYAAEGGWVPFEETGMEGNRIVLKKASRGTIISSEILGKSGYWLKCRLKASSSGTDSPSANLNDLVLDGFTAKTDYYDPLGQGGLKPDMVYFNDIQADPQGFYPFGDIFTPFGTVYFSSKEAFSKRDGTITLKFMLKSISNRFSPEPEQQVDWKLVMKKSKFEKPDPVPVSIVSVQWEYWNGNTWIRLSSAPEHEKMFYLVKEGEKSVTFHCPADMQETFVNSQYNYWIRARILSIDNMYAANTVYLSPWIEQVTIDYRYDSSYSPQMCISLNNAEYRNLSENLRLGTLCQPFTPLDCKYPSLYLGFNSPPVKGPISAYISIRQQKFGERQLPVIEWEYLRSTGSKSEWSLLKVNDETNGFTQSGTIQFVGPHDLAKANVFGSLQYWLRAVNRDSVYEDAEESGMPKPIINGIYFNTTRAVQMESVNNEIPVKRSFESRTEHLLARTPILRESIWVDETGHLSEEEIHAIQRVNRDRINVLRDSEGGILRVMMLWAPVDSLTDSMSEDRHYTIDRISGIIRFGNGVHGKNPPNSGVEQIKANYKITRGKQGNVGAFQITNLQNSIAFVNSVLNPEPSGGGCDAEMIAETLRRGPQRLKHRDRAVGSEDFEWLARQAYPNIAKVKCLPNTNTSIRKEIGCITLVILTKEGLNGLLFFTEMKRQVEKYIMQRTSNLIAFPGQIQVIEPAFLEISVTAMLVVNGMERAVPTEIESIQKLNRFLDPLTGNYNETGWEIGQQIHISVFYALLKSIPAVNHVEKLYMNVHKLEDGHRTELDVNKLDAIPHGIIVNGTHNVVVSAL